MKRLVAFATALFALGFVLAPPALADEAEAEVKNADWRSKAEIWFDWHLVGFQSAKVIRAEHDSFISGRELPHAGISARAKLAFETRFVSFFAEPYMISSSEGVGPTLAGLKYGDMLTPFDCRENDGEWLLPCIGLGYFHHSAHNFSDATYGSGTYQDGLHFEIRYLNVNGFRPVLWGFDGRAYGRWFWGGVEPAGVITRRTYASSQELEPLKWMAGSRIEYKGIGMAVLDIFLKSSPRGPSSLGGSLEVNVSGPSKIKHLDRFIFGPEFSYAHNLHNASHLGLNTFTCTLRFGLRLD